MCLTLTIDAALTHTTLIIKATTWNHHSFTDACIRTELSITAVKVIDTEQRCKCALIVHTCKLRGAICIAHTCRSLFTGTIDTLLCRSTVSIIKAHVCKGHTLALHTALIVSTVVVNNTGVVWLADLTHAAFSSRTIGVSCTFTHELALEVHTTLPRTTVSVQLTPRVRNTETKLTHLATIAVIVASAVGWRERNAHTCHAACCEGTLGIALTTAWCFTHIVLTKLSRNGAIGVALTDKWRCTTTGEALPCGRTIRLGCTCCGDTVSEVAALSYFAILVNLTVRASLAEEAVTDAACGALGVGGALTEVNTTISKTLEARATICIVYTLHISNTCA